MILAGTWILLSVIGAVFNGYELYKSIQTYNDIHNKVNGKRIVATDILIRSILMFVIFLVMLGMSITTFSLVATGMDAALQLAFRNAVNVGGSILIVILLLAKSVTYTVSRLRLENSYIEVKEDHHGQGTRTQDFGRHARRLIPNALRIKKDDGTSN